MSTTDPAGTEALAINGGTPAVSIGGRHEIWPPPPGEAELAELVLQRQQDISIKGRTGIIREMEEMFLELIINDQSAKKI